MSYNVATSTKTIYVSIPLCSGLLNSDQDYPLYLAPLTLQIGWAPSLLGVISEAGAAGSSCTNLTFNEISLVYESIEHNIEFLNAQKQLVAQGNLFNMGYHSAFSLIKSSEANLLYTIGCGKVSVNGILYQNYPTLALGASGYRHSKENTQTDCIVSVDGVPINSFGPMNMQHWATSVYAEMRRVFGSSYDSDNSSYNATITMITGDSVVSGTYFTDIFLGGMSLRRTDEAGFVFPGTPVSNLLVQLNSTPAAGDTTMFHILFSAVASFDGQGMVVRTS